MSRFFGPLRQMGFVVATSTRRCAIGSRSAASVRGTSPKDCRAWLLVQGATLRRHPFDDRAGQFRRCALELIQQRDDTPSMYRDFLAAGHEGLQHWSSWPENYHELLDRRPKEWPDDRPARREPARPVRLFPQRGPSRHSHRNGRADPDAAPHLRCGARRGARLGRKRPDPPRLAARLI